jgi:hypothetical protein
MVNTGRIRTGARPDKRIYIIGEMNGFNRLLFRPGTGNLEKKEQGCCKTSKAAGCDREKLNHGMFNFMF